MKSIPLIGDHHQSALHTLIERKSRFICVHTLSPFSSEQVQHILSQMETINDINAELINFYRVVQQDYISLEKRIKITLHSRDEHRKANVMYNIPDMFPLLERAWAIWVLSQQSFCSILDGAFGYDRSGQTARRISHKREEFTY